MTQNDRLFRWTFAAFLVVAVAWALWPLRAGASEPEPFTYKWYKQDRVWGQYYCHGEYRAEGCWRRWRHHKPAPNSDVMSAQLRLQQLGYGIEVDGFVGAETREVLLKFQLENDLKTTGELDAATKYALREMEGKEYDSSREKRQCLEQPLHVWSGQHNTEGASKADAQKRWMIGVQAKHGSIYMNFANADPTSVTWRCFQSQSHDTLLGKGQAVFGKIIGGEGYFQVCELWARPCSAPVTDGGD